MGTSAGFGQMNGGNTGVGSAPTQANAQTQAPAMGGKGGGYGTSQQASNPYAATQPQIPSQNDTDNLSYKPLGGNIYGYNMNRLASRLDPSASLPPPQQASTTQQAPQSGPTGGKGGGQGAFGIPEQIMPFAVDAVARSYGYQPYEPSFFQQQGPQPNEFNTQQANPFAQEYDARMERLNQLERQYQDMIQRAQKPTQDTGETLFDLPKAYEEQKLGVGQTPEEKVVSDAKAEVEAAKIDPVTGKPRYQFGTYETYDPNKLVGFSKQQVSQLYGQKLTQAKADIAEATRMQKAAKTPEEITAANKALADAKQRQADYTAAQKQSLSQVGKTGYQTQEAISASAKAAADAKAKAAADKAAAEAAKKAQADAAKKTAADAKAKAAAEAAAAKAAAKTTKKKATGGVIHNGMSSNLKKMLGE